MPRPEDAAGKEKPAVPARAAAGAGASAEAAPDGKKKKRPRSKVRELVECLLVAGLLALTIRQFGLQLFKIPTRSMEPTLLGNERYGDRVLAAMWYDRGRFPALHLGRLDRWQVLVFRHRDENGAPTNFIKRLVGLPGERLEIRDGDVWINGRVERKPPRVQEALWLKLCDLAPPDARRLPFYWQPSPAPSWTAGDGALVGAAGAEGVARLAWTASRPIDNRFVRHAVFPVECPDCGRTFQAAFDTARPVAFCPRRDCPGPGVVWGVRDDGSAGALQPITPRRRDGDYWTERPSGLGTLVPDLRLWAEFEDLAGRGELEVALTGRQETWRCVLSLGGERLGARLLRPDGSEAAAGSFARRPGRRRLAVSGVDGAFSAELDGERLGPALYDPPAREGSPDAALLLRDGARVAFSRLRLDRDIHYSDDVTMVMSRAGEPRVSAIYVPEGKHFFLGDNPLASLDSRKWGFKEKKDIVARGIIVIWPPSRLHPVW